MKWQTYDNVADYERLVEDTFEAVLMPWGEVWDQQGGVVQVKERVSTREEGVAFAERCRAARNMWRREWPTTPGWYWVRQPGAEAEAVRVVSCGEAGVVYRFLHTTLYSPEEESLAEWRPLTPPE